MPLTDKSDVFLALLDSGVNRVINHLTGQRPSLFNYATESIAQQTGLLCRAIAPHPVVIVRNNPLVTVLPPLPVIGSATPPGQGYGLDFCVQLTAAEVDLHPGNVIDLPAELLPPLAAQRFALRGSGCGGFGCPVDPLAGPLPPQSSQVVVLPALNLLCSCFDVVAVGSFHFEGLAPDQHLVTKLEGLELVDLAPANLEESLECYAKLLVRLAVLPRVRLSVKDVNEAIDDAIGELLKIQLAPSPLSPALPHNPAVEDNQVKLFIDLTATSVQPGGGGGGGGGGGTSPPPYAPGVVRSRSRTGPADATAAISEGAVQEIFAAFRDGFVFQDSNNGDFGPFKLSYEAKAHLVGGSLELRTDTIQIRELDIIWDTLKLCFAINIPEIPVGSFCLVPPIPIPGVPCVVEFPGATVFSGNPDIEFCLDIGSLIRRSELSVKAQPVIKYAVNTGRTPAMNDWDAHDAKIPNRWEFFIDPDQVDFDLIDIADVAGDLVEQAISAAIDGLLGGFPEPVKDIVSTILGPIDDVLREVLDLGDDFEEWFTDKVGFSLNLFNHISTALADYLLKDPLFSLPDPIPIIPEEPPGLPAFPAPPPRLIPVQLPLEFIGARIDEDEIILQVDIGN